MAGKSNIFKTTSAYSRLVPATDPDPALSGLKFVIMRTPLSRKLPPSKISFKTFFPINFRVIFAFNLHRNSSAIAIEPESSEASLLARTSPPHLIHFPPRNGKTACEVKDNLQFMTTREDSSIGIRGRDNASKPLEAALFLAFLALFSSSTALAGVRNFTCKGADVKISFPSSADQLIESSPTSCVYWLSNVSGVYREPFGVTVIISSDGQRSPEKFEDSSDPRDGTWSKLQHSGNLYLSDENDRYSRIDEGIFKSKYLVSLPSGNEIEERTSQVTSINGTINEKGLWIKVMIALPYKHMTRADAVNMIKSTAVLRGMKSQASSSQSASAP